MCWFSTVFHACPQSATISGHGSPYPIHSKTHSQMLGMAPHKISWVHSTAFPIFYQ